MKFPLISYWLIQLNGVYVSLNQMKLASNETII